LKTRKLLIFRDAKNAENSKIAANWDVYLEREILPWPLGSFNFRGAGVVELELATIY